MRGTPALPAVLGCSVGWMACVARGSGGGWLCGTGWGNNQPPLLCVPCWLPWPCCAGKCSPLPATATPPPWLAAWKAGRPLLVRSAAISNRSSKLSMEVDLGDAFGRVVSSASREDVEPTRAKPCPGDVTPSALLILSPPPKAWNGVHGRPGDVVARLSSRCAPNKGEAAGCMAPVRSASREWCQAHCTWPLLRCSSAPRRKGCRTWSASAPQNANVAGSTRGCPSPARCAGNCDAGHRAAAGARVLPGLGTAAPSCPLQGEGSKTRNHRDGGEATGAGEAMRGASHVGCELYRTLRGKRWSLAPRHAAR